MLKLHPVASSVLHYSVDLYRMHRDRSAISASEQGGAPCGTSATTRWHGIICPIV